MQEAGLAADVNRRKVFGMQSEHWPAELRLKEKGRLLSVTFDDGMAFGLTAEYLRVSSPSAEVRGHSPAERITVAGKIDVAIADVIPVGNYAVRLVFNDGHQTGIFTWAFLHELGSRHAEYWARYLDELAAKNLSRGSR